MKKTAIVRQAVVARWFAAAMSMTLSASCAQPAPTEPAEVAISGDHSLVEGETLALSASTAHGTDASYNWASSDVAIATVDSAGVVTGVAPGEAFITATGADTAAEAEHVVVVIPAPEEPPTPPELPDVAHLEEWLSSPHADTTAEAFIHWDEDGEVPANCARCHTSSGYSDYLGADGTAPGSVEAAAPTGQVVDCNACHSDAANTLSAVTFPSGAEVSNLGPEARCMVCHQGRSSGDTVNTALEESAADGPDVVDSELGFINVHYYPAAATLFAGRARGGYQYDGMVYDYRFRHVEGFDSCVGCHDAHTTQVKFNACSECHTGVSDLETARGIRMIASRNQDYDGDGNTDEGIYGELDGLRTQLLASIKRYGAEKNNWICYDSHNHPYFFIDGDHDGECSTEEAVRDNRYASFTPRLLKATYNYQIAVKDPGAFAHNAKYMMELLYDSLQDLNGGLVVPFDLSDTVRSDVGHFDGASEAARHWDEDESVSASCSRCHSGSEGFRFYIEYGGYLEVPETGNGLDCATCHTSFGNDFDVLEIETATFAGNKVVALDGNDGLCVNCHSGRASKATIDAAIATAEAAGSTLRFQNVHYLAAGALTYGSAAGVGYEYDGKDYTNRLVHDNSTQCISCHDPVDSNHTFAIADVWDARCDVCHADANSAEEVREVSLEDYDGDGNVDESLKAELDGLAAVVIGALNDAATPGVCYGAGSYPYFFKDTNGSGGICDADEAVSSNGFGPWTGDLLKAAHNYQLYRTEPGAYMHNFPYMGQLLYDSAEALGTDMTDYFRPLIPMD